MGKCILAGHGGAGGVGYGTYTGNGEEEQTITLGVTPKWVLVLYRGTTVGPYSGTSIVVYGGLATQDQPAVKVASSVSSYNAIEIVENGFKVLQNNNTNVWVRTNASGAFYNYIYGT